MDTEELVRIMYEIIEPLIPVLVFSAALSMGVSVVRIISKHLQRNAYDYDYHRQDDYIPTPTYYVRTKRKLSRAQRRMLFHRGR